MALGCGPLIVIAPDGDTGATKELELDEAEARCRRGEPCACYAIGSFKAERGDDGAARDLLDRSCSSGCAAGCADLRDAYFDGRIGARRNPEIGTRYAIRACRIESARCAVAGDRFESGSGVARDLDRAKTFFGEGCRRGDAPSCAGLERLGGRAGASAPPGAARARATDHGPSTAPASGPPAAGGAAPPRGSEAGASSDPAR
jgi:hypothetical protein